MPFTNSRLECRIENKVLLERVICVYFSEKYGDVQWLPVLANVFYLIPLFYFQIDSQFL